MLTARAAGVDPVVSVLGFPGTTLDGGRRQRSSGAAPSARRSWSPITVAPELTGRGGRCSQMASRSNSKKKS
jgi:hypothetical protein